MQVYHSKTLTVPDGLDTSVVRPSDWNSTHIVDIVLSGHTSGSSIVSGSQIVFNGGQNMTLSADTALSQIVFSGPDLSPYLTTAMQSGASASFAGTSAAMTGGSITMNTHGLSIALPNYLTTADASQNSSNYAGVNGAITGGSMTLNTSGLSISLPAYLTTAQSPGAYLTTAMQSNAATISNIKVSAGASSANLSALTFSDSQGISFGLSAGTLTATVATNYQSQGAYLTTAMRSDASSAFAGINGAMTGGSITLNTSGASINLPAYLTTAAQSGATSNYAGTGTTIAAGGGVSLSATLNTAGLNLSIVEIPISRYVPYELLPSLSAASSGGINTLHVFPLVIPSPISFGQINLIGSASVVTTAAPNTVTISVSNGSTMGLTVQASVTASRMLDFYLFTKGTGVFSTQIGTFASTENSFVTFMSMSFQASISDPAANSTANFSMFSSYSHVISLPGMSSGTQTSLNANSTATTWGTAYMTVTGSTTASTSNTGNTTATFSSSLAGAYPSTTMFSGNRYLPIMFATSLSPGEYWVGMLQRTSSSSASGSTGANLGAGNSLSFAVNASVLTTNAAAVYSSMGMTSTVASSLGFLGSATQATMAPAPGHGSFTATFSPGSTYVNNMGQGNGVIGFSQINSNVSFWRPFLEFASVRF